MWSAEKVVTLLEGRDQKILMTALIRGYGTK